MRLVVVQRGHAGHRVEAAGVERLVDLGSDAARVCGSAASGRSGGRAAAAMYAIPGQRAPAAGCPSFVWPSVQLPTSPMHSGQSPVAGGGGTGTASAAGAAAAASSAAAPESSARLQEQGSKMLVSFIRGYSRRPSSVSLLPAAVQLTGRPAARWAAPPPPWPLPPLPPAPAARIDWPAPCWASMPFVRSAALREGSWLRASLGLAEGRLCAGLQQI